MTADAGSPFDHAGIMALDEGALLGVLEREWQEYLETGGRGMPFDREREMPLTLALARLFLAGRDKRCECGGDDGSCLHQDECLAWHAVVRQLGTEK